MSFEASARVHEPDFTWAMKVRTSRDSRSCSIGGAPGMGRSGFQLSSSPCFLRSRSSGSNPLRSAISCHVVSTNVVPYRSWIRFFQRIDSA